MMVARNEAKMQGKIEEIKAACGNPEI